jgi:dTDP-4-amino-4,6-dideoxygalactose transaminase
MDQVMQLANAYNILVVEDCALAFGATYNNKHLGRSGHLSAFSFHETKTIACGEGGCLLINDSSMYERAEIIWEKGTNRAAFSRGEVNKYEWVDIGSSYLMSEIQAAWLSTQIDNYQLILQNRKKSYNYYFQHLSVLESEGKFKLPVNGENGNHNASVFYLKCATNTYRDSLMHHLQGKGILAVFHYLPLHQSPFFVKKYKGPQLVNAENWSDSILRMPLFYGMEDNELEIVTIRITEYQR